MTSAEFMERASQVASLAEDTALRAELLDDAGSQNLTRMLVTRMRVNLSAILDVAEGLYRDLLEVDQDGGRGSGEGGDGSLNGAPAYPAEQGT